MIKIKGTVSEVRISDTRRNLAMDNMEAVGSATAVAASLAGLSGAAVGAAMASDSSDEMEYFTCKVDGKPVSGCFKFVRLQEGDKVMMAVQPNEQGYECYAICWPKTRKIVVYPYAGRGLYNFWVTWMKNFFLLSVIVPPLLSLFMNMITGNLIESLTEYFFFMYIQVSLFGIGGVCMLVALFVTSVFSKYARRASEVFRALGFKDPDWVDLRQRSKDFLKRHHVPAEELENDYGYVAWIYRY